jgi:tol-pal system protein YbgF
MVLVPKPRGPALRPALLVAATACTLLVAGLAYAGTSGDQIANPAAGFAKIVPPADLGDGRILVAQNKSEAQLLVRIQDLEEQIRTLTGQVEGLQFQLTQMQTMLQKQGEDNEFRFQQLEGGTPAKKPQAAVPTDGATPSDALPQGSAQAVGADQTATPDSAPLSNSDQPMDGGLGESADPLLGGGTDQLGTLSTDDQLSLDPNRPLDLSLDGGPISNGDANAQYAAGYDAITRGDYAFAEDQFQQFIALYPDDPQAPDATNWLGEALLQRGAFTDAAEVLANGYTKYKESKRAPDMMLKLGVALAGADKPDVACRTFFTLKQRYPDLSPAFLQRLAEENQKAKCPVS